MTNSLKSLAGIVAGFVLLFVGEGAVAQFRQVPLGIDNTAGTQLRTSADVVPFPFWDDFTSGKGLPDVGLWESGNVVVSPGMGVRPLSRKVAVLDALTNTGAPYSSDITLFGGLDTLTSKPIDLASVPVAERDKVFFNFYWEAGGEGSYPDTDDSLSLEFLKPGGEWSRVWSVKAGKPADELAFSGVWLKPEGEYYHDAFRFRFVAYGNMSGAFDTWLLDYVRLSYFRDGPHGPAGESPSGTPIFDRTLVSGMGPLFGEYYAVPMEHYRASPAGYASKPTATARNLNHLNDQPMTFNVELWDAQRLEEVFDVLQHKGNAYVSAGSTKQLEAENTLDASKVSAVDYDSLHLEGRFILSTGDKEMVKKIFTSPADTLYFDNVNLRVNDTVKVNYGLSDYYAYDDGSAEYAAGISQAGGEVATKFVFGQADDITHVRMYFPTLGRSVPGTPFQLRIYRELSEEGLLHSQDFVTALPSEGKDFIDLRLYKPVRVDGEVYIGWYQKTSEFLAVGLDKNTDSGSNIFFKVTNEWEQNDEVKGSLLLRPVLKDPGVVTGVDPTKDLFRLSPNPNDGTFELDVEAERVNVYDLSGASVPFRSEYVGDRTRVSVESGRGVYLIRVMVKGESYVRRFLIK
ncbi:hypothetical protein FUAX_12960 [Fulvitalea axinellae]|uniref:T9SS type A sorting domain-containing protein n=1 Tax=Fulvitalea axinellae TaxID=1182444 RepID=A0AAU9C9Y7_9BACT|nr:hypothetical protein FUAX_12960 [Fulvitalea axinellae]